MSEKILNTKSKKSKQKISSNNGKKTKIKIIAFVALVASMASIACGNEKVRQCVEYLNTSVKNTKEHKIKEETWRAFEKEKERLKNTETEKTQKNGKPFWRLGK